MKPGSTPLAPRCASPRRASIVGFAVVALLAAVLGPGAVPPASAQITPVKNIHVKKIAPDDLPYTITQPGTYFLFADPGADYAGAQGIDGITIEASDVVLDLAGHTLRGEAGSLTAIRILQSENVVVQNGTIRDWGEHGIAAFGSYVALESLRIVGVGDTGVHAPSSQGLRATDCTATLCDVGFNTGHSSVMTNCKATDNAGTGFENLAFGTFEDCVASRNQTGFLASFSVLSNCASSDNAVAGFVAEGSIASGCSSDGSLADNSGFRGGVSIFADCNANVHSGAGFNATGYTLVSRCVASSCRTGIDIAFSGNFVVGNVCRDSNNAAIASDGNSRNARIEANHLSDSLNVLRVNGTNSTVFGNVLEFMFIFPGNDAAPTGLAGSSTNPWINQVY